MEVENHTQFSGFLLLGFSEAPELQPLLFGLFLSMYMITMWGNLLLILAVGSDPHLHTPMYFFLSNLSLVDICFTSTTVPKMLHNLWTHNKAISFAGCLSQMYFFILFAEMDIFLLSIMAYDRYAAICHPLHYTAIMHPRLCGLLVLGCWVLSIGDALVRGLLVLHLSFCPTASEIPHFFCEVNQVLQLACSDNLLNLLEMYLATVLMGVLPLSGIIFSYSQILSSILRLGSSSSRHKAFSTCSAHLSVVSLFYGTGLLVYLSSAAPQHSRTSATASVIYTVVTPMLNPFIYSLRNQDIKVALRSLLSSVPTSE